MWPVMASHDLAKIYALIMLAPVAFAFFVDRIAAWWRE